MSVTVTSNQASQSFNKPYKCKIRVFRQNLLHGISCVPRADISLVSTSWAKSLASEIRFPLSEDLIKMSRSERDGKRWAYRAGHPWEVGEGRWGVRFSKIKALYANTWLSSLRRPHLMNEMARVRVVWILILSSRVCVNKYFIYFSSFSWSDETSTSLSPRVLSAQLNQEIIQTDEN